MTEISDTTNFREIADFSDLLASASCLLPGIGGGPRTLYARTEGGDLVHVSKVETGTSGLVCPDCRREVRARKFKSGKTDHFYHRNTDECRTSGETALHVLGKELLSTSAYLAVPSLVADSGEAGGYRSETFVGGRWVKTYETDLDADPPRLPLRSVRLEVYRDGIRPDLIVTDDKGRELYVEILVTHRVDDKKKTTLRKRNNPTIEINLSQLDRAASIDDIRRAVIQGAPRDWVHNSTIEARLSLLHEQEKQERRDRARKEEQAHQEALKWAKLAVSRWRQPATSQPELWSLEHYRSVAEAMQRASGSVVEEVAISSSAMLHDGSRSPFTTAPELVRLEIFSLVVLNGVRAAKARHAKTEPELTRIRGKGFQIKLPPRDRWSKSDLMAFIDERGFLKHGLKDARGRHLATCRSLEKDFAAAGNFLDKTMSDFVGMDLIGKLRPRGASRYSQAMDYVVAADFLRCVLLSDK